MPDMFDEFARRMREKYNLRNNKKGNSPEPWIAFRREHLEAYLLSELAEYMESRNENEMIDVANVAMFIHIQGKSQPPSPPAEMPEIDPKTLKYDHCGDSQIPPILTGACIRYGQKVGKKEENSCVGCTVGCTGKGKQVEIIGTDGKVHYRRPEGDPLIQEALSRGLTVREQESK